MSSTTHTASTDASVTVLGVLDAHDDGQPLLARADEVLHALITYAQEGWPIPDDVRSRAVDLWLAYLDEQIAVTGEPSAGEGGPTRDTALRHFNRRYRRRSQGLMGEAYALLVAVLSTERDKARAEVRSA
jgi:hypothetical protein